MNHRVGQSVFAVVVGLAVAVIAYQWITNPAPRQQRQMEEHTVLASRELLLAAVGVESLEIVDPLAPDRKIGKVYIYAEDPGWAVSGYYRRDENDRWHPYLLNMTSDLELHAFKAEDAALEIR
jgi:hypothetical protein